MIQEDSLDIDSHFNTIPFQAGEDSLNYHFSPLAFIESKDSLNYQSDPSAFLPITKELKDPCFTFSFQTSRDSLNAASQLQKYPVQEIKKPLTRFFVEKGTSKINEIKLTTTQQLPIWIHLSLLFWLVVVVFTRQSYTFRLTQIFTATFNQKQAKQIQREGNILKQGYPVLLMLLYVFTISLFAFQAINFQVPNAYNFSMGQVFLILFGVIVLFYLGKFISIWFLGLLFETRQISYHYLLDHYLFYISEGIILFPLLVLYIYSGMQFFIYASAAVLIILWAFRLLRAIINGLDCTNFSRSYLFLYLCSLELLPIFLLYKLSLQFI